VAADPQWLRSSLAEDLAAFDRAHGRIPHTRSIERVVDEDIRRWQAVERERKATPPPAAPVKVEGDKRHDVAKRTAEGKQGEHVGRMRFDARDAIADEQRAPCACGGAACRRCKLRLRTAHRAPARARVGVVEERQASQLRARGLPRLGVDDLQPARAPAARGTPGRAGARGHAQAGRHRRP
jgi:hypothetical protein